MPGTLLTFAPGQTSVFFDVTTLDDEILEYSERLFAEASSEDTSVTVAPAQTSINITDNDGKYLLGYIVKLQHPFQLLCVIIQV